MKYSRSQLKCEVKGDIRQSRPKAILVTLVFLIILFLISIGLSFARDQIDSIRNSKLLEAFVQIGQDLLSGHFERFYLDNLTDTLMELASPVLIAIGINALLGLASSILTWTLSYGYQGYCLNMVRRKRSGFGRLFCAFPQWGWVLLTRVLIALFVFLWSFFSGLLATAATVAIWIFLRDKLVLSIILTVAAWLIASVFSGIYIPLRYSMANYVLLDERTDALEAISRSKAMLRGRKWHLFVLRLSFIGWYLIAVLIAGLISGLITSFLVPGGMAEAAADPLTFVAKTAAFSALAALASRVVTVPLMMWLKAYSTGAEAKFYDWMKQADIANGVWENDRQYKAPYNPRRHTVSTPLPVEPEPEQEQAPEPEEALPVTVPDAPEEPQQSVFEPEDILVSLSDLPVEETPGSASDESEQPRVPDDEDFCVPLSELPVEEPQESGPDAPEGAAPDESDEPQAPASDDQDPFLDSIPDALNELQMSGPDAVEPLDPGPDALEEPQAPALDPDDPFLASIPDALKSPHVLQPEAQDTTASAEDGDEPRDDA